MIELQGFSKRFGDRLVLRDIDLKIAAGERVALVGPNGSGKTTMMRAVLGLIKGEGRITVAGADPWADHARAMAGLAYVPQRAPALPGPVGELAAAWAELRGRSEADLGREAAAFGLELEPLRKVAFRDLSGGMQQKLLAAMAFASPAGLLLFDEPTANLDPQARSVFLERLAAREPSPTLLLTSHRMEELKDLVTRVIVLAEGKVRFDGPVSVLEEEPELARMAGVTHAPLPFRRSS